jgi:nucleotide-binding universal stress UspA family protein
MIDRVLVPLDGSRTAELALDAASALARPGGGTLILLHAVTPSQGFSLPATGFLERERRQAAKYLAGVAARLRRKGIRVDIRLLRGEASRLIVRTAIREKADFIAISGRGRGGAGTGPLGSVAERVLRTSPVPVLLLRRPAPIRRVLVPLDASERSLAVMAAVGETARPLRAKVALLHVGNKKGRVLARAMDVLARLDIPGRIYVRPGRAARTIEDVADEMAADLVAISAAPATGDRKLYLGSVAEELLRRSERPLLVVRREGGNARSRGA